MIQQILNFIKTEKMLKKTTINGKEYKYDYKVLWVKKETHRKLKLIAAMRQKTMVEVIVDFIDGEYSKSI